MYENLSRLINNDVDLNKIFTMTFVDRIWNTLITQLNIIINTLAPSKVIQLTQNHVPYINSEFMARMSDNNKALTEAIQSNDNESRRVAKNVRSQGKKYSEMVKSEYMSNMSNKTKTLCKQSN